MLRRRLCLAVAIALLTHVAGCADWMKERELQKIAKDWCMTIRASQVIPVYPLTEDLQPGDVFLVTTPVQTQAEEYRARGFLPLDMHVVRLQGFDYRAFYQSSFGIEDQVNTPHHWQFPKTQPSSRPADPNKHRELTDWRKAPRADFPSYTFNVRSGAGLKLAFPVEGVPVALNLMQTDAATGSITIADSYVYGVSLDELRNKVEDWAAEPSNKEMLRLLSANAGRQFLFWTFRQQLYLRVVNRVYLTGRVVVSLNNDSVGGVGAVVGQAQGAAVLDLTKADAAANFQAALAKLNEGFQKTGPGGELRILYASSRSVTLSETFDRPLAIGYLGFDFPVMADDGSLGPPVATQKTIMGVAQPVPSIGQVTPALERLRDLLQRVNSLPEPNQEAIYGGAARILGEKFDSAYKSTKAGPPPRPAALAFSITRADIRPAVADDRIYRALKDAWEKNK